MLSEVFKDKYNKEGAEIDMIPPKWTLEKVKALEVF